MRRWIYAAAMMLVIPATAAAQGFGVGAKGGVSLATQDMSGTDAPSTGMRVGPVAGGFVTLPLVSWLGLQVEGLYESKGAKVSAFGIDTTLQIDYFEVPLLARMTFGEKPRRYFVDGGAVPALRLRATARTPFAGATEDIDVADQVERFDVGVAAGGGMESGRLVFDARYTFGLRNIDADPTAGSRTRNRAFTVTAGFRF
jgi:hypothetical protein